MSDRKPVLWWVRRDLRLTDNPALEAAIAAGGAVVPVFVRDGLVQGYGAMPRWRLGLGLEALAEALEAKGSRLILRSGDALEALTTLAEEVGAGTVIWSRLVEPGGIARDSAVKAGLRAAGIEARSTHGHFLFDPWTVATKTGQFYKVYTPFWKAVKDREVAAPTAAPAALPAPAGWPASEDVAGWDWARAMDRGAAVVRPWLSIGEPAATARLGAFVSSTIADYDTARDLPAVDGTSRLSEHLSLGEISPRACWQAGLAAREAGKAGAETFLKELVWREFAHHLAFHTPHIATSSWRPEWDGFPWSTDPDTPEVRAWQQGRTGIRFVDAAMRELYVTGYMHNRGRMIVGSYLCKHLMCHWKIGLDWFAQHLRDWDPASNAMGWQWVAGSGPDATPYFRVFNPVTQLDKFDRNRDYAGGWIAEGKANPTKQALSYFDAIPRSWGLSPDDPYPDPVVTPEAGRARALAAYEARDF